LHYVPPVASDAELRALIDRIAAGEEFFAEEIGHQFYAGDTPLHVVAAAFRPGLVRELLSAGADVSARNRRGAQALHYAADANPTSPTWDPPAQREVIECLLGAGADPNAGDKGGVTPLHRAVRNRCAAAVDALLKGGADPSRPNGSGSTPAQLALWSTGRGGTGSVESREQQKEIVRLLGMV